MLFALVAIMGLGLVDSYFISYLGTTELAAIGFIVPITSLVSSFGLGLGMAISSLTSKLIGAQKSDRAARLITDGFFLTLALSVITMIVIFFQVDNIFRLMGATGETMPAIKNYMLIWIVAVPLVMVTMVCSSTFRALGDTSTAAKIAISMTLVNLILDPLLIFGLGPFPELGMSGAAYATVIAVMVSFAIGIYQLGVKEQFLVWALPQLDALRINFRQLLEIAIPAVLANAIVPLTSAILINVVARFGTNAVAAYGVGTRIEAVTLMLVYALSSTLPMFIGQNLGAERKDRVHAAIRLAFRFVIMLQLGLYLVLLIAAPSIASLFSEEHEVRQIITTYLWIVPLSYGLSGVVILINVSVNVLGKPRVALYINILRLMVFYLPFAYLGAHWFGLKGLFIGVALGNCCAYLMATLWLNRILTELDIPGQIQSAPTH